MQCEWCQDAPAVTTVELEPAKYRIDKRTRMRVTAKPPKRVNVCRECEGRVEAQMERARHDKEQAKKAPEPF